ncbi:MAG: ABC transporter ATP-binding protein [Algicola sp.]|nr:ABC transporter ATP-binding protein [Algicola sp.]
MTEQNIQNINENIIVTKGMSKRFGKKLALDNCEITISQGGIHALIGANGAGKSTLFRILLGFDSPTTGSSTVLGMDSQALTPQMRGRIGYVNEEHTLPTWMTAGEVTQMQKALYPQWQQAIYDSVIGNFDVEPDQKISGLSRGERAGLNLSMALAQSPELLILDEPTLGLDVVAKQAFLEALMHTETDSSNNTTTIVYCSHQMEEIERVADNLIIIEKGQVKYTASPDELCERISYWICNFESAGPVDQEIPGLLSMKVIEGQHHIMVIDQPIDTVKSTLLQLGADEPVQAPVNLDKAVNSLLAKNHKSAKKAK